MEENFCPQFIADVLAQCKANPDRICVTDGEGRNSTYGEFLEIVERTSGYIAKLGIPAKSFIVINLANSMDYLAVEFGCWLSGCAVCPVNPLYPKQRVDYITSHCEASLVVEDSVLESIRTSERLSVCKCEDDIAAIFYTSGSTGNPKGVVHTFSSLSRMECLTQLTDITADDCFASGAPFSFIAQVLLMTYLRKGARVRLLSRSVMTDSALLQQSLSEDGITGAFVSPSALRLLDLSLNCTLKIILTGTEKVSFVRSQSSYKLYSVYGMTECTPFVSFFEIDREYDNTPIGKVFSDLQMKLSEEGEICLRGALSPGYYKDPERSAELWRDGWFHTGDLARMLPDGNLLYLNRKDWMVKINGQRVEPGESAAQIRHIDGVSDAVVKGFTAKDGQQYMVGFYVADESVDSESIRQYLSGKLAPYMIPAHFVKMTLLPRNVNGKVDIAALQSPLDVAAASPREVIAPVTDLEKELCSAFESALGISPISVEDDFFALGGDSIRVMKLQRCCKDLPLTSDMVWRSRTVKALSEALSSLVGDTASSEGDIFPLSKTQEGIFAECMNREGEAAYNNPFLCRVPYGVDALKLARACEKTAKAHPNIFASIGVDETGVPFQKRISPEGYSVEVENISDAAFQALRGNLVQPFSILSDRLFRMRVFRTESAVWLFTDFHHIIFDGTSNGIFFDDLEKAYDGEDVADEDYTGFDVAFDEARLRKSPLLEECRKWNLSTFGNVDNTTLPDPDRFSDKIAFARIETATGISAVAFSKCARRLGVTENILAIGAFGYMLGACSHGLESAFATVYNGRKSVRTARTVSMMVKTLPVRCAWDASTTVKAYLDAVKEQLSGSMAHDLYSFSEICSSTSFDSRVLFTWQDTLLERNSFCSVPCEITSLLENATGEPLAVQLYINGGALFIRTEYRSNMYSEKYIEGFISCFANILSSMLGAGKDDLTSSFRLVDEAQEKDVIAIGSGDKVDYEDDTFLKMFRKVVSRYGDLTAVVDEEERISYSALDAFSDSLAARLLSLGVKKEEFVALMLPRLRYHPVSFIACFKCGAAFVPMDSEYPIDRLQYMLEDSEARVLITTRAVYEDKCREAPLKVDNVIFVDEFTPESAQHIDLSTPDGLAYMIYTSGTTGKPKGVMIEHHSLANFVHHWGAQEDVGPLNRIAAHASFSFDGSLIDLVTPLCFGGELHILPSSIRKDLSAIYSYFCENKIDGCLLTTQLGMAMLNTYDVKLKFLMMGGEKLSGHFRTRARIYNAYGPTEFTVASSMYLLDNDNIPDNIPIGRAFSNTISAIVDALGRPLPKGVAGELVLIGSQLARGYWHREDLSARRFAPCPFIEGEKMYHTGDLVRWSEDGNLLYLGRIDKQVKLRGFRIELGEVESTMAKFPGIRQGVVAVKEISGLQHLCAYYCSEGEIDDKALREFLASSLTDYMVPTAFVRMETMPMTPNGKVDVKNLPVPQIKAGEIVSPEGAAEEKLFDITSEFLGNDAFGVTTNLITMGLTSLGAITLSLLIEKRTGWKISSSAILRNASVRQWAGMLSEGASPDEAAPYPVQDDYPVTDNQTGIYIDWEQHRDSTQYNVPMLLTFEDVSPERVVEAVNAFIAAHPYIKTHFVSVDGSVRQKRLDDETIKVAVTALESEPTREFFQSKVQPFNLFEGPLCRFEIVSYLDKCYLFTDVHHIIFDGGSESIFTTDIIAALNGRAIVPEKFTSYDYSLYYQQWKASDAFAKAESYYTSLLDGAVSVNVPSTGAPEGEGAGYVTATLDRAPVSRLCRAEGVTENAFFLTAVTEVLHRLTREDHISILTVSNGRSLSSLERSTGMFVQTLPVASHKASRTISDALRAMHSQVVETVSRDKYPFTKIVEKCGIGTNILVAYQGGVLSTDLNVGGKPVTLTGLSLNSAKFPLSIVITPGEEKVTIEFEYDRSLFCKEDISLFAEALKAYADNMACASGEVRTDSIACVSEAQSKELLDIGYGGKLDVEPGLTIVKLFHRNALLYPDDTAVVDECSRISYGELDRASSLLASILISKGVRKEDFVGLMLPRRKEFVISFLAAFKSGGAYVPLDYEYPIERLQYMMDDSKARVLITTRTIYEAKAKDGGINSGAVIFIDETDLSSEEAPFIDNAVSEGLAYMIYTSGTTGKPKGVMLEHRALVNTISWYKGLAKIERGTRDAQHPSFSFDASILDFMPTLAFGGEVHILGESLRKDPEKMYHYLTDNAIEIMCLSTQLGMLMLNSYDLKIRYIMMGGEKLVGHFNPDITVVNGYGPTEFAVCSSYHIVDSLHPVDNIPIGRAVPNTVSAVVDPFGNLLPQGAPGELVLVGPQTARGYFGKEDITAKRFVKCPFAEGRMYHTGDLARWSPKGELLFMGRIDTQVKLRGFRIELGEIESAICRVEGVNAAVAQVREISGTRHLCAYYTASSKIDPALVKREISATLTSYMVPDALMQLEAMPLTPNGKINLKALPEPDLTDHSEALFEAPEGEVEEMISDAFAQVLGIRAPVSRNSSFFQIGGTSLLVMKVIVRLSDGGLNVTYGDLFKYPTARTLAAFVDGVRTGSATAAPVEVPESTTVERESVIGEDGYDYTAINDRLSTNTVESIGDIRCLDERPLGDVLLLGATGYLGIHILNELLTAYEGNVYCVVRAKRGVSCEGRLKSLLMYYFDRTGRDLFGKRIFVIEGDMTDDAVMEKLLPLKVDTVINCAANVKHFAAGDEIDKINLHGAEILVDYCLRSGARLIQTSTHSISGQMEGSAERTLFESSLYIGQKLVTKYQKSKFAGERVILEAVTRGLDAKIMRLGNLMPRYSDGEFQINMENNGFMSRMRAYYLIGCIASSHLHSAIEFAPIDQTASAVLTLARTPGRFTVFHSFNNHNIYVDDVVAIMRECGLHIDIVSDEEFSRRLNAALEDDHLNPYITTLLAYGSHNNYVVNPPSLDFTVNVLNAMDWRWRITGERYLMDAFEKLIAMNYFDK